MREVSVTYLLSDEQEQRLRRITEEYKKQGLDLSPDQQFNGIMAYGSDNDINRRFAIHEQQLGIRE